MRRWALLVLLLALSPVAQAQVWTPTINPQPLEDLLLSAARWALRLSALFTIGFAIAKLLYGRLQVGSGLPGVVTRGHQEVWEALSGIFWFAVALVALPFALYAIASAGLLPQWVASLMSRIIEGLWNWSI
jgi:uncharacterized membrane protein YhdT